MAFGNGSMTRPSISMAPSFFGISSAVLTSVFRVGAQNLPSEGSLRPAAGPVDRRKRVAGMTERTLCAERPYYAGVRIDAKPAPTWVRQRSVVVVFSVFSSPFVPFPLFLPRPVGRPLLRLTAGE